MSAWLQTSDRACDAGVCGFALWTVCAHVATGAELGLDALLGLFAAAVLAAVAAARAFRGARTEPPPAAGSAETGGPTPPVWLRGAVTAGAGACVALVALDAPVGLVWAAAAALTVVVCARELLVGAADAPHPASRPARPALLVALALACAAVSLASHRPDADDAFYLNVAVSAADDPRAPVLARDTLHGVPDVPLPLPVYRVHSLELLEAAVSRLTGLDVLTVAHVLVPLLAGLLVPLAIGRLARWVLPRSWPFATAIAVGVLLCSATASHGFSNFGLVRLHQGKALLLTVLLPLVAAYAIELSRRGGARAWVRLAAAQIAAVGVSASALWLAPATAAIALLAGSAALGSPRSRRRLLLGLAASGYVLVLALALRGATVSAFETAPLPSPELELPSAKLATQALRRVIGPGLPGVAALFAALGAWAFAENAVARRLCAFSAGGALLLWTPFGASLVAAQLTGAPTYWRVLWLLPVPILVAVVLASPMERPRAPWGAGALVGAAAVLLFGSSVWLTPRALAPSAANQVRLAAPGPKVPPRVLDTARAIVDAAGPGDRVLAPRLVAPWIVALHGHPSPLVVRREYLPVLYDTLGRDELERRLLLLRLVSGDARARGNEHLLRDLLETGDVPVVCLARRALQWPGITRLLERADFQRIHENADYEVWKRSSTL